MPRLTGHMHASDQGSDHGFTLIELLVVMLILAILAVIGIVAFGRQTDDARESAARAQLITAYQAAKAETVLNGGDYLVGEIGNYAALASAIGESEPSLAPVGVADDAHSLSAEGQVTVLRDRTSADRVGLAIDVPGDRGVLALTVGSDGGVTIADAGTGSGDDAGGELTAAYDVADCTVDHDEVWDSALEAAYPELMDEHNAHHVGQLAAACDAMVMAMTLRDAVEDCAAGHGGDYTQCDTKLKLGAVEGVSFGSAAEHAQIGHATASGYRIDAYGADGSVFQLPSSGGTPTCTPAGDAGCPVSGAWSTWS